MWHSARSTAPPESMVIVSTDAVGHDTGCLINHSDRPMSNFMISLVPP